MTAQPDRDMLRTWVHLHLVPEVGAVTFRRLLTAFGSPAAALRASRSELREVEGVGPMRAEAICRGRDDVDPDAELARADAMNVSIVVFDDPAYPPPLKFIHDPPALLYVLGTLLPGDTLAVGVVGSRHCSAYGKEQAHSLSAAMARAGITVVSGLARGIDTAAHRGALSSRGRTIAVLGSGLAEPYPPENLELLDPIAASGAVISEFPLTTTPAAHLFPQRNRVISGLSLGVLVVEAPEKSGSLITATCAGEQGREVFAVPGRVDQPFAKGCHRLIREGAKLVESLDDILDALGEAGRLMRQAAEMDAGAPAPSKTEVPARSGGRRGSSKSSRSEPAPATARDQLPLTEVERKVMDALASEPGTVDDIVRRSGLSASEVNTTLTRLELKSLVTGLPGGAFRARR